jgi:hypothetical protein
LTISPFLAIAGPPERYNPAAICPPRPDDGVKFLADYGNRKIPCLLVFEGWDMHRLSTIENQPSIPKIKTVLFEVLLPLCLVPFKYNTL